MAMPGPLVPQDRHVPLLGVVVVPTGAVRLQRWSVAPPPAVDSQTAGSRSAVQRERLVGVPAAEGDQTHLRRLR